MKDADMSSWQVSSLRAFVRKHAKLLRAALAVRSKYNRMRYRRQVIWFDELVARSHQLAHDLPNEYDLIIGVPRAGLIPATILAEEWGRPLSTPDDFLAGIIWQSHTAERMQTQRIIKASDVRSALVIDDSTFKRQVKGPIVEALEASFPAVKFQLASVFANKAGSVGDLKFAVLKNPNDHLFEWSLPASNWNFQGLPCTDMDGVICEEAPLGVDYETWLKTAKPRLVTKKFDAIITGRLEFWRTETQAWLAAHGVEYRELIMYSNFERLPPTFDEITNWKARELKQLRATWYIESSPAASAAIWRKSGVPVACISGMRLYE